MAEPTLLASLAGVKDAFAQCAAENLGPLASADKFKVLVTDAPNPKIERNDDVGVYCTVALMLNTEIRFCGNDITELVERKKIFNQELNDEERALYAGWEATSLEEQKTAAKAFATEQMTKYRENDPIGMALTEEEFEKEKRDYVDGAVSREDDIGPRFHNIIKLHFVEQDGIRGAIVDSYFYYTDLTSSKLVKRLGLEDQDKRKKNDMNKFFKSIQDFVYKYANGHFIALLDAWSSTHGVTLQNVRSEELQEVAIEPSTVAARKSKTTDTVATPQRYIMKKFLKTPENAKQSRYHLVKHYGYYGTFGFITKDALKKYDESALECPAIVKAFQIATFNSDSVEYPGFQQLIDFCPITVELIKGTRSSKISVSLSDKPINALAFVVDELSRHHYLQFQNKSGTYNKITTRTISFFNMLGNFKIVDLITKKTPLKVYRAPQPPPMEGFGSRKTRSRANSAPEAAFIDLC